MTSQYARVLTVLEEAGKPLSLFEIKEAILARFKRQDSEAGISARIRDIRHDFESQHDGTVQAERVPGKAWFRYQVRRDGVELANDAPMMGQVAF